MFTGKACDEHNSTSEINRETLVDVREVSKRYQDRFAIENLDLTVRAGEVFGLVGANGGGKTTALRILAGILHPDQGRGQVVGLDLIHEAGQIRKHIGYMSQRFSLYGDLTVIENLRFRAEVYELRDARAAAEASMRDFELEPFARSRAGKLSGGWARRLQFAAALIQSPRLVLLDEPTAGLDAVSSHNVWRRIGRLAADGVAVIVSSHDLAEAERCSRAALLSDGTVVATGTPQQIAESAPGAAFLLSGAEARRLQHSIEGTSGVVGSYPQGENLRVVTTLDDTRDLIQAAKIHGLTVSRVEMRLEDAVLAYSSPS